MKNTILILVVLLFSFSVNAQEIIKLKSYGVDYEDVDGKKKFSDNSEIHLNFENNTMAIINTKDYILYEFRNLIKSDETEEFYLLEYRATSSMYPCIITILIGKHKDFSLIVIEDIERIKLTFHCKFLVA